MTSRYIERHKDYDALLLRHERLRRLKNQLRLWVGISFILGLGLLLYFSLQEPSGTTRPELKPLLEEAAIPYKVYGMDAQRGETVVLGSGTVLYIPAGAFLQENGHMVRGQVNIRYREFRDPVAMAFAGVSMRLDSARQLVSAGMFEFVAFQGSESLRPNPDRPITVDYPTSFHGRGFKHYYLDMAGEQWQEKGEEKLKVRFGIAGDSSVYPELGVFSGLVWELIEEGATMQDLSAVFKKSHACIGIGEGSAPDRYRLSLGQWIGGASPETDHLDSSAHDPLLLEARLLGLTDAQPLFEAYQRLRTASKEKAEDTVKTYQKELEAWHSSPEGKAAQRSVSEYQVVNHFVLEHFGLWNCGRPFPYDGYRKRPFHFVDASGKAIALKEVKVINDMMNTVFTFYEGSDIRLHPQGDQVLFGVLPGNRLAYAKGESLKKDRQGPITLKTVQLKENTEEEIRHLLGLGGWVGYTGMEGADEGGQNDIDSDIVAPKPIVKGCSRPGYYEGKRVLWICH